MQFAQLLELKELGVPVPTEILIKSSTLQNKKELVDAIVNQEQQQQQMAQQQSTVQMEVLKAQIKDLEARAMANEGLGFERASRIHENRALAVERLAEAQKDRDMGALDRVKALKELTDMDLGHLERAVGILKALQEDSKEDEKKETKTVSSSPQ